MFVGALKAVSETMRPFQPILAPMSVVTKPIREVTCAVVSPVTDAVIDGVGEVVGASQQSRDRAKVMTNSAVNIATGAVLVDGLTDPDTWDSAVDFVVAMNQPGADGTYAWSPS